MSLYYQANEVKKKDKLKTWRKGQPGWKIGVPILTGVSILCVTLFIATFIIILKLLEESNPTDLPMSFKLFAGIIAFLVILIPGVIIQALWLRMIKKTAQPYEERRYEFIRFGDNELIIGYHNKYHKITNSMVECKLPYEKIKDIQLNEQYGKLQLVGNMEQTHYEDYSAGVITDRNVNSTGIISTLLYFDEEEKLLEELEKRVGFHIKHVTV